MHSDHGDLVSLLRASPPSTSSLTMSRPRPPRSARKNEQKYIDSCANTTVDIWRHGSGLDIECSEINALFNEQDMYVQDAYLATTMSLIFFFQTTHLSVV